MRRSHLRKKMVWKTPWWWQQAINICSWWETSCGSKVLSIAIVYSLIDFDISFILDSLCKAKEVTLFLMELWKCGVFKDVQKIKRLYTRSQNLFKLSWLETIFSTIVYWLKNYMRRVVILFLGKHAIYLDHGSYYEHSIYDGY